MAIQQADPLVAIPAALCTAAMYPKLREMADGAAYEVPIPDADNVRECAAEVSRTAPDRFVLIGTSWGAQIALEVALGDPARVTGLCLIGINAGPHPNPSGIGELARSMPDAFEATVNQFADECIHAPADRDGRARRTFIAMADQIGPERSARQLKALGGRPDRRELLAQLQMPVLLLWGEQDRVTPVNRTEPFTDRVANCALATVPGCGHLPTIERPDAALKAFVSWRRASALP